MKKYFVFIVIILGFHFPAYGFLDPKPVNIQIPDMRFYSVKVLNKRPFGKIDLIASGQVKHEKKNKAMLVAFSIKGGKYKEISREVFHMGPKGPGSRSRIRSMVCVKMPSINGWLVVVNGKGGPENHETGFIRSYIFNKTFTLVDSMEFSDPSTSYTHGYPLISTDINNDGKNEIIYGGFSGQNDRDRADIRIFKIGERGQLAQIEDAQINRLNKLRLRINALASGDLNQDGKIEVVVAGRTIKKNIEHGAFTIFSDESMMWKQLDQLDQSRYRYAEIADVTGDGRPELVLGGRVEYGKALVAMLDVWQVNKNNIELITRYCFTGAGSTRLRLVKSQPKFPGRLIIGGRIQTIQKNRLQWKGFIQQVVFKAGTLLPSSEPVILEKDFETRVRTMDIAGSTLIAAGFTEDETKASSAFISIYSLK